MHRIFYFDGVDDLWYSDYCRYDQGSYHKPGYSWPLRYTLREHLAHSPSIAEAAQRYYGREAFKLVSDSFFPNCVSHRPNGDKVIHVFQHLYNYPPALRLKIAFAIVRGTPFERSFHFLRTESSLSEFENLKRAFDQIDKLSNEKALGVLFNFSRLSTPQEETLLIQKINGFLFDNLEHIESLHIKRIITHLCMTPIRDFDANASIEFDTPRYIYSWMLREKPSSPLSKEEGSLVLKELSDKEIAIKSEIKETIAFLQNYILRQQLSVDSQTILLAYFNSRAKTVENFFKNSAQIEAKVLNEVHAWLSACNKQLNSKEKDYTKRPALKIRTPIVRIRAALEIQKSGCFIASAVYGDYRHPDVEKLRLFRDNTVKHLPLGPTFIRLYYWVSPRLSVHLVKHKKVCQTIKYFLKLFI